jgi:hypothetical protein
MILQQIFFGIIAVALGIVSLKYNFQLVNMTGNIGAVERFLGAGSTYFFFKMLSVVLVIGGLLYMTGLGVPVLTFILAPLAALFPHTNSIN